MQCYELTSGQKLLFYSQSFTIHKQVNNIFILMLVKKELDFDTLRAAIGAAYEHNDCFRLRLIKKDGKIVQYFAGTEKPDIRLLDFRGKTQQQMDRTLSRLARRPIRLLNRPLTRVHIVHSPDGLHGVYFGVSHLILDSWGICMFMEYVMKVYESMRNGLPMPTPLSPLEPLLQRDLAYADSPQHQKDLEFWRNESRRLGEPILTHINGPVVLEKSRKKHKNPNLRYGSSFSMSTVARHEVIEVPAEEVALIESFCSRRHVSMQSVFMFGLRTALSRLNNRQKDINFMASVARRGTIQEKHSGGSRVHSLPVRSIIEECATFADACRQLSDYQTLLYRHADIGTVELMKLQREIYGQKGLFSSYLSGVFTFQPIRLVLSDGTPLSTKWICNGTFSSGYYLTVMDADGSGGLRCYYEYQYRAIKPERIRMLHSLILQTIGIGVRDPARTVGEILDSLDERAGAAIAQDTIPVRRPSVAINP